MTTTPEFSRQLAIRGALGAAVAGALGLLAALPAQAQQSPYYAGVVQNVNTDSNVYRAAKGSATSRDTISATGLRLGVDQTFGRQHLVVSADANANRYARRKELNNTDYALNTRLDWSTLERVSGVLSFGTRQSLYRLDGVAAGVSDRNMLRSNNFGLQAQLGVVTDLSFDAGVSASQDRYSAALYRSRNLNQKSANFGLRVRPGSGLTLRVGLRHGEGRFVDGADVTKRDDVDFSSAIELSGASTLNARLSRTQERHQQAGLADSRGWTGGLGWNWKPLGRVSFGLDLTRDGSVSASGFDNLVTTGATTDTRIQNRLGLRADWEISAAWRVNSAVGLTRRTVNSRLVLGGDAAVADQTDRTLTYSLGLSYAPVRNIDLSCNISQEDRKAEPTPVGQAATFSYAVTSAGCSAQIYLR
ncbi:MAG: hypothetical protein RLZZ584_1662 [Pseudomonadota bacterium]|jgi:hypothetical protein